LTCLSAASPPPPVSALPPYTTLFRSIPLPRELAIEQRDLLDGVVLEQLSEARLEPRQVIALQGGEHPFVLVERGHTHVHLDGLGDRKSTRLNSSHVKISYAVFCLKKK